VLKRLYVRFTLFLCVAAFVLANAACGDDGAEIQGEANKSASNVVATVRGEAITAEELNAALQRLPEKKRAAVRKKVLDTLIEERVFAEEARKKGLQEDPQVKKALEKATNETLARYFVRKRIDPEAEPSEETLKKFYTDHKDQFLIPEGVQLQEVVVKDEQKAREILKSLREGASFEALATEHSIAGSGKKGGHLGWLFKGKMDPALEKVAFSLEKNALSDVVKTKNGYQVVKLLNRRDPQYFSFEEAKFRIKQRLFWTKKRELIAKYYDAAQVNTHPTEPGVLAKIGKELITEDTLAPILAKVPEENRDKAKLRWIDYFIETKVFSREARNVALESDPEVAREIRRLTEKILAVPFRQKFITDNFQITDTDIAGYYESHPELFRMPTKARAKSILVKTRQEAEDILKLLKEGASFVYLAQQRSLHPNASRRGGEIGWFSKGEKDPAVEKVAFALKKGEISDVIKTDAGFEIIKLMGKQGGGIRPLDEVGPGIRMTLTMQKFEQEKQHYYKKAGVKVTGT
jgi:peptidyl-prolyl cis-trans isomerase C